MMRKAARPSEPSVGTRSKKLMSSSIVMAARVHGVASWHKLIAARLGDQDRGRGGILLDLLPQPVDVGFQGMGGDAGIVAPDLLQERLARHRLLSGAVEIAQDLRLLLGEADLAAPGMEQHLRTRPERERPDREDGIFARLVLAQLRADAREQH